MKTKFIFVLLLMQFFNPCYANETQQKPSKKRELFIAITIPKSGTHLLEKLLSFFGLNKNFYEGVPQHSTMSGFNNEPLKNWFTKNIFNDKHYLMTHMDYTEEFNSLIDSFNVKKILIMRDPRATLISSVFFIQKRISSKVPFEQLLFDLIDKRHQHFIPDGNVAHWTYSAIWEMGFFDYYKTFLPFIESKNCLTIRFEDLVGVQGGGLLESQLKTIKQVASHIGIEIDDKKITEINNNLFGGTWTFREGKIDDWKKHFTPKIKAAVKAIPGANQLLIDLGYEKDENW